MSTAARVPHLEGLAIAEQLSDEIRDVCDRIEVAGSLRRMSETVGDVELVVAPRLVEQEVPDGLWGTTKVYVNLLLDRLPQLLKGGGWRPHPVDPKSGERYAKFLHAGGIQVDLFMVLPPAQFGVIHLIRTGSASYSEWFVKAVRGKGMHVGDGAIHRGSLGCGKYTCEVVDTPDEKDVYARTGIPFTPAHLRA